MSRNHNIECPGTILLLNHAFYQSNIQKAYHPVFVNCPGHISGQILRIWPDFDQFLPIHPDKIGLRIRTNWLKLIGRKF